MISHTCRMTFTSAAAIVAVIATAGGRAHAQANARPPNDLPNPYRTVLNWAQLPDGRKWGSTVGVDIGPDGNIWIFDRCGGDDCAGSKLAPILKFDPSGKLLKSFGEGMFVVHHGLHVDKDGNVWVTDRQGNGGKGLQVVKFSPDGKVLLTLGKAGVAGDGPDTFNAPNDVVVAANGDIFVADGHGGNTNARIVKFSKDGKFIQTWGKKGSAPGEFDTPHGLDFDSRGRLFVADRTNNRIQIFDQGGKFLAEWKQFGRPSGIFIDHDDTIYVADSESTDKEGYGYNPGCKRGIRIGSAKDGKVTAFIPDPAPTGISSWAEGVAVDHQGNVYGAEYAKDFKKYVKKQERDGSVARSRPSR